MCHCSGSQHLGEPCIMGVQVGGRKASWRRCIAGALGVLPSPSSPAFDPNPASQRGLATHFLAVSLDLQSTRMIKM